MRHRYCVDPRDRAERGQQRERRKPGGGLQPAPETLQTRLAHQQRQRASHQDRVDARIGRVVDPEEGRSRGRGEMPVVHPQVPSASIHRDRRNREQRHAQNAPQSPAFHHRGPRQVEVLLHAQRPEMADAPRPDRGRRHPDVERVGEKERPQIREPVGFVPLGDFKQMRAREHQQDGREVGRQQPQRPRAIEPPEIDRAGGLDLDREDPRDQESAQDEKHVDAVPAAAAYRLEPRMAARRRHVNEEHGRDADCAQTIEAGHVAMLACNHCVPDSSTVALRRARFVCGALGLSPATRSRATTRGRDRDKSRNRAQSRKL